MQAVLQCCIVQIASRVRGGGVLMLLMPNVGYTRRGATSYALVAMETLHEQGLQPS